MRRGVVLAVEPPIEMDEIEMACDLIAGADRAVAK